MSGFNLPPGVSARDIPGNDDSEDLSGGPAFPANHFDLADNERGMTLVDYFAARVFVALIAENYASARDEEGGGGCPWNHEDMAGFAYEAATWMIAERKKWQKT